MEAALSQRKDGVGSPVAEHENVAVDPTKSCCVVGVALTDGATIQEGGRGGGISLGSVMAKYTTHMYKHKT